MSFTSELHTLPTQRQAHKHVEVNVNVQYIAVIKNYYEQICVQYGKDAFMREQDMN